MLFVEDRCSVLYHLLNYLLSQISQIELSLWLRNGGDNNLFQNSPKNQVKAQLMKGIIFLGKINSPKSTGNILYIID
ncbi:hypothetical protein BGP_0883 [Beggiatoa sp. PS]|nr:hypothetical protein BGP_0883 [Beggiatoa sp. PS]